MYSICFIIYCTYLIILECCICYNTVYQNIEDLYLQEFFEHIQIIEAIKVKVFNLKKSIINKKLADIIEKDFEITATKQTVI